jgi:uncharacterized membrane protein
VAPKQEQRFTAFHGASFFVMVAVIIAGPIIGWYRGGILGLILGFFLSIPAAFLLAWLAFVFLLVGMLCILKFIPKRYLRDAILEEKEPTGK